MDPSGSCELKLANEWSYSKNMWSNPAELFPPAERVYSNLGKRCENCNFSNRLTDSFFVRKEGRVFPHPVMHKPPWNYVTYEGTGKKGKFLEVISIHSSLFRFI